MRLCASESLQVLGGGVHPIGTFTEYVVVERDELIEVPEHMSLEEAAAWPCGGITAYRSVYYTPSMPNEDSIIADVRAWTNPRAVFIKGQLKAGQNVLIVRLRPPRSYPAKSSTPSYASLQTLSDRDRRRRRPHRAPTLRRSRRQRLRHLLLADQDLQSRRTRREGRR